MRPPPRQEEEEEKQRRGLFLNAVFVCAKNGEIILPRQARDDICHTDREKLRNREMGWFLFFAQARVRFSEGEVGRNPAEYANSSLSLSLARSFVLRKVCVGPEPVLTDT
jgi:hypothetical protein